MEFSRKEFLNMIFVKIVMLFHNQKWKTECNFIFYLKDQNVIIKFFGFDAIKKISIYITKFLQKQERRQKYLKKK